MADPFFRKSGTCSAALPPSLAAFCVGGLIFVGIGPVQHAFFLKTFPSLLALVLPFFLGGSVFLAFYRWYAHLSGSQSSLAEDVERYQDLFENANDLIQSVTPDGSLLYANRAWRETLGYDESEVPTLNLRDIIHSDCFDHCMEYFRKLLSGASFDRLEAVFVAKDGRSIAVEGSVNCHFENGRPIFSRGIFRNISERKKAQQALHASELRYRSLVENIHLGIALVDKDVRVVMANSKMAEMLRLPMGQIVGQKVFSIAGSANAQLVDDASAGLDSLPAMFETPWPFENGEERFFRIKSFPAAVEGTEQAGTAILTIEDITEQKLADLELRRSHEFSATVLNSLNDAVAIIDVESYRLAGVNTVFLQESGLAEENVLGRTCHEVTHRSSQPCRAPDHTCPIRQVAATGKFAQVEHCHFVDSGATRYVEVSVSPVFNEQKEVVQVVHVARDITERKIAEAAIQKLAYFDPLTGLPNRLSLQERLQAVLAEAEENMQRVAILFLDLDQFKVVNDTLGHAVGDELLKVVAGKLEFLAKEFDFVARLGGDEFVLLHKNVQSYQAIADLTQNLLEAIAAPISLGGQEVFSTVSVGVAFFPEDGDSADTLLMNADTAMYEAKDRGRNCLRFYSQEMNRKALERLQMSNSLRNALRNEEFHLVYQPQFDLAAGRMVGAECLLRWNSPEFGEVSPQKFIPLAEESGLIVPLGEWVLRQACLQAREWLDAGFAPFRLAVNLSGCQFRQPDLVDTVEGVLKDTGFPAEWLELELTESMIMDTRENSVEHLIDLKVRGVHLAIDDFGTGYSSLSYLKYFPIDRLKIAQEFVRHIPADSDSAGIVAAIVAMGRSLGINVLAEGVETKEQLEYLRALGCFEMQGYYLGRPVTADRFATLLKKGGEVTTLKVVG